MPFLSLGMVLQWEKAISILDPATTVMDTSISLSPEALGCYPAWPLYDKSQDPQIPSLPHSQSHTNESDRLQYFPQRKAWGRSGRGDNGPDELGGCVAGLKNGLITEVSQVMEFNNIAHSSMSHPIGAFIKEPAFCHPSSQGGQRSARLSSRCNCFLIIKLGMRQPGLSPSH
ncbi:hypothetical protein SKAU_G00144120 [Synaphobranchus kaupii]|uniref:Uncharacterized protein n=1 Tax=Synaphobranchus kaupii TaxID=118154 RepID=A0A9Q1FTH0_SYNKA|nr:hypothetical protein SKAU_G00144120 [Synaphobranchus kaupii]